MSFVTTKRGQAASQSVEIYQGQPPTAQSHTAGPEYNPALTHPTSLMIQAHAMIQSCWYMCVYVPLHTPREACASICGHVRGRVQAADMELNGSTVALCVEGSMAGDRLVSS